MLGERFYDRELSDKWGVPVPKMPGVLMYELNCFEKPQALWN